MWSANRYSFKLIVATTLTAALISGCSSSSDSAPDVQNIIVSNDGGINAQPANTVDDALSINDLDEVINDAPSDTVSDSDNLQNEPAPQAPESASVTFDITVPVYVSNALQVQLAIDDTVANASWVADESWMLTEEFATGVEHAVVITFSDRNGALTLGSHEFSFNVESRAEANIRIRAVDFNTQAFDSDMDGVSNLQELLAGTNPEGADLPEPVQATLEMVPEKTFRLQWNASQEAQFYRVLENPDGLSGYEQIGDDLDASTLSYDHRVALYLRSNASYIVQACNAIGCVDSQPQTVPQAMQDAVGFIQANSDDFPDDFPNVFFDLEFFGVAVTLSGDGNSMAVGISEQKYNENQNLHYYQGVYVLERVSGSWEKQAYLKPRYDTVDTFFGYSLSFNEDGTSLAVGASSDRNATTGIDSDVSDLTAHDAGAVFVYDRINGSWQEQAYIKGDNTEAGDKFGSSVRLSADGNTLAVGARKEDSSATGIDGTQSDNMAKDAGAAYVFSRVDGSWQQSAYLKASNTEAADGFGASLALSSDGNILAVSATGEDSAAIGINGNQSDNAALNSGAAYVFVNADGVWEQQAYIKASNTETGDRFAHSLALNLDGSVLAVTALWESSSATGINGDESDNNAINAGAAYVFTSSDGDWQQQAYLKASNTDQSDQFGGRISMSADGHVLAIGAFGESSSATGLNGDQNNNAAENSGAVYVFTNKGDWQQQAFIKSNVVNESGSFGGYVSLTSDGESLAVSATREEIGAVYLY